MQFKVKALDESEYKNWLADMKKIDGKKEVASTKAQEGQEIFNKSCIGCHAVDLMIVDHLPLVSHQT